MGARTHTHRHTYRLHSRLAACMRTTLLPSSSGSGTHICSSKVTCTPYIASSCNGNTFNLFNLAVGSPIHSCSFGETVAVSTPTPCCLPIFSKSDENSSPSVEVCLNTRVMPLIFLLDMYPSVRVHRNHVSGTPQFNGILRLWTNESMTCTTHLYS
jgi:hypothetical protein